MEPIPSPGVYVCNAHRAEKSPMVQPTRHRNVFMLALFHVPLHVQKICSDIDRLSFVVLIFPAWL
jgi:hypothetical protein